MRGKKLAKQMNDTLHAPARARREMLLIVYARSCGNARGNE